MAKRKRSLGESIQIFFGRIIGGLGGLGAAAFAFLGPLNPAPQVLFDQVTGFAVLFITAVLAYAGIEIGGWMMEEPKPMHVKSGLPTGDHAS